MQVVHTKTREEYDELMDILDKKGGSWEYREPMKVFDAWKEYEHNTCIDINDINNLLFWPLEYEIKEWSTILSLNDYKKMNDIKEECEFKRGERIMVRDDKFNKYEERIFISFIEWAEFPYIVHFEGAEFKKWKTFQYQFWRYAEKKPTYSQEDIQKAKKLLIETWEKWSTF